MASAAMTERATSPASPADSLSRAGSPAGAGRGAVLAPPIQTALGNQAGAAPELPRSPSQWIDTDVPSSSLGDPFGRQSWVDGVTPRASTDLSEPPTTFPSPIAPGPSNGIPPSSIPFPPATNHPRSLASYIAANPTRPVRKAISKLYPRPPAFVRMFTRWTVRHSVINGLTDAELREWEEKEGRERRREAGWRLADEPDDGSDAAVVSPLFWKMYTSLLPTLLRDPLSGLVPPALLGSTTTMPISIISLIPDIMKHYRDCIVRAKHEVFLITNYWQPSNSVTTIAGALKELSELHLKRNTGSDQPLKNIVVKLIYDRGSWEQLVNAHANVPPKGWGVLKIPLPEEIPGIDLQVMNYHKVLLGTLHVKLCIVDRRVALINSNNIQDRPNLEMMTHLEGPIVDSFYEAALLSWNNKLEPILPCIDKAYQRPPGNKYRFADRNPYLEEVEVLKAAKAARLLLRSQAKQAKEDDAQWERSGERFGTAVRRAVMRGMSQVEDWAENFTDQSEVHPSGRTYTWGERMRMARGSRPNSRRNSMELTHTLGHPIGHETHKPGLHKIESATGQSEAQSSMARAASPTLVGESSENGGESNGAKEEVVPKASQGGRPETTPLDTSTVPPPSRSIRIEPGGTKPPSSAAGSISNSNTFASTPANGQAPVSSIGSSRAKALSERFNAGALSEAWATVEDTDDLDTFKPHILHKPHKPFPIAMCCRKPHGMPGHHDIRNPQNAAWLAGFRYAKKRVFIQTPTLNARPIRRAIKQTCRRGVEVILFLDLGFNDKGESIPFQGGTNEQVVEGLYNILRPEGKAQHLKVYWYTGKDQIRPLNAIKKQRNAHIKFANFDDQVAILGNGNQDTQSWFHSSEANIMIDSPEIIAELMETLYTNQNTHIYGLVEEDGVWRDEHGKTLDEYGTQTKGKQSPFSGIIQFAKTI